MKVLVMIVMVVSLFSCNVAYEVLDEWYEAQMCDHDLYSYAELDMLSNLSGVSQYIKCNIDGDLDGGYQNPKTTYELGTGNCTSYSIAFLNALYLVTGEKANVIFVDHASDRSVVNGSFDSDHAIVELADGTQIEPQTGCVVDYEVLYRYSFNDVF